MLPKPHRLPASQIRSVMRRGRRVSAAGLQLIYRQQALPVSRFAFVIPVSVDKRAVVRNRVRRLVRESVRLVLPDVTSGRDGVFMLRKSLGDEFVVVDNKVREALRKAGILNESIIP